MIRFILLFIIIMRITPCLSQNSMESDRFLSESINQLNLEKQELLVKFIPYDFSSMLVDSNAILGFVGNDYQRLKIRYLTIIKDKNKPDKYFLYGKTKLMENVLQFLGEVEIIHIRKIKDQEREDLYKEALKQNDDEAIKRFSTQEYILLAKFHFCQDPSQNSSGIFQGIWKTKFSFDNNKIYYDGSDIESDTFSNNLCVGTWTSYKDSIPKKCNWGEKRIPNSGDLDIGAGLFSPNPKYFNKGWEIYYKGIIQNNLGAKKEEQKKWW